MKHAVPYLSLLLLLSLTGCGALRPAGGTTDRPTTRPRTNGTSPTAAIRADIVEHAEELLGIRYKFGGNTPKQGFDCSGLTRYLYQYAGLDLERVSRDQATQGRRVSPAEARPGDLVFYRRGGQPVFHVSVVVDVRPGQLWVVHATSSRGVIRENVLASSYWKDKLYQVRDVLN